MALEQVEVTFAASPGQGMAPRLEVCKWQSPNVSAHGSQTRHASARDCADIDGAATIPIHRCDGQPAPDRVCVCRRARAM
jgi:hypothetical protein